MKAAGCDKGDIGGVICCNGKTVTCIWIPATGPGSNLINECFEAHEKDHFDDITCDGCGKGQICRPPFKKGKNPNDEECSAYKKEIACYNKNKKKCSDKSLTPQQQKDCRAAIDYWLKDACDQALTFCGRKPSGCP